MSNPHWPMFDLRLTTPDLELRHLTEADLGAVVAILPDDAEQDPASYRFEGLDAAGNLAAVVHQDYWRARGRWRADSWELAFGAFRGGELVGYQGLEGDDFATLRTVDSSSFLAVAARGRGLGKQMRAAVLALAFGSLGALVAVSSSWTDNAAALGVSHALGYVDNGVVPHRRGDAAGEMAHLRLSREAWLASGWPAQVRVSGVEPCLVYLGLA
jgi:RimJ/RimL family protein N-acetyltransferase